MLSTKLVFAQRCNANLKNIALRLPPNTYSQNNVIEIFHKLHAKNIKVNYPNIFFSNEEIVETIASVIGIRASGATLFNAAKRLFKDWDTARKKAGLIPMEEDPSLFGKEEIKTIIKNLYGANIKINQKTFIEGSDEITQIISSVLGEKKTGKQLLERMRTVFPKGGFKAARKYSDIPEEKAQLGTFGPFTEEKIKQIFQLLHDAGIRVNKKTLFKNSPEIRRVIELVLGESKEGSHLYNRAQARFGTFRNAQLQSGLNPNIENQSVRINQNTHFWKKDVLVKAILAIFGKRPLDTISMRHDTSLETLLLIEQAIGSSRTGSALYNQINRNYGSWYQFLEKEVGLNSADFRPTPYNLFWTKDKIRTALYWLDTSGIPLNIKALEKNNSERIRGVLKSALGEEKSAIALLQAIYKEYKGDYRAALEDAGINPKRIYLKKIWSKSDIIRSLKFLYENSIPLNFGFMRKSNLASTLVQEVVGKEFTGRAEGLALLYAAAYEFGSLDRALAASGINPMNERQKIYTYSQFANRLKGKIKSQNGTAGINESHFYKELFEIVDGMSEYKKRLGYLVLDTMASEPLLIGNYDQMAERISMEYGKKISPGSIRNFLTEISHNQGFEGMAP